MLPWYSIYYAAIDKIMEFPNLLIAFDMFKHISSSFQLLEQYRVKCGYGVTRVHGWCDYKHPLSLTLTPHHHHTLQEIKVQYSVMKLMATVFWDAKGHSVNAVKYSEILDRLNKVVCKKKKKKDDEYIYISASPCYTATHSPHMTNLTKDCLSWFVSFRLLSIWVIHMTEFTEKEKATFFIVIS